MADEHGGMIDDELRRQLDAAGAEASLGAVFTLRGDGKRAYLSPDETRAAAEQVVERAARAANARPHAVQVFANLQSFAVQGPPALVRAILEQPEVETASANVQPESALIPPVSRRDVEIESAPRRRTSRGGKRAK